MSPADSVGLGSFRCTSAAYINQSIDQSINQSINLRKNTMSKVTILAVNEVREIPTKSGGKFPIQDAECMITEADGSITVGALSLPRELVGKGLVTGDYVGVFKWVRDYKNGRLVNELQGLTPAPPSRAAPPIAKAA